MTDRIFAIEGDWALASDGIQWMLMKRVPNSYRGWKPVSFVRSTRDILVRCMREKGTDDATAVILLSGLPSSFDEWKCAQAAENAKQAAQNLNTQLDSQTGQEVSNGHTRAQGTLVTQPEGHADHNPVSGYDQL